ncbi:alpha-ketoglutarate-dependent dioxygenase AlkB [Candidatus Parabeggiatoa sp. HSG14]|uniref:alpha-ketoglutarate-dependent dioxygenase AlkB family protein n=1 Tax=Candidatus Parabeggiatoa sp. HSG14 TaxID=3055593 RepID=UPI0025A7F447|nr:alpha-ketoglutarate-dependent dioxygenase AlkB [Thiotrichales bacterium HSG14]
MNFFNFKVLGQNLFLLDIDITFCRNFFKKEDGDDILAELLNDIKWRQEKINMYGKELDLPRLTAWYGNDGKTYTYSGIIMKPEPWTPTLLLIKQKVEKITKATFNSVLLNLYRDGKDSISWHSDDEAELGKNPTIASVSFGATRKLVFKHKFQPNHKMELELEHGSLLTMKGTTQHLWKHQVPKTKNPVTARVNLTFRTVY